MVERENKREILSEVRSKLDNWIHEAKNHAFEEIFEDPNAEISKEEIQLLDEIDSHLTRKEGEGIWNSDRYGIVSGGTREEGEPHVVCTNHPQIPEYTFQKEGWADMEKREKLNDALWKYSERVVEIAQKKLERYIKTNFPS